MPQTKYLGQSWPIVLVYNKLSKIYVHTYIHITLFSSKMSLSLLVLIFTSILYKNKKSGPSLLSVSRWVFDDEDVFVGQIEMFEYVWSNYSNTNHGHGSK